MSDTPPADISFTDRLRRCIRPYQLRLKCMSVWRCDDLQLAYIAVPKAASSSIRNLIRDRQAQRLYPDMSPQSQATRRLVEKQIKHSTTPARLGSMRNKYYFFSFVRNPISRLYSCYRDKVVNAASHRERCSLSAYSINFGISFDQFIDRIVEIPDTQSDQHFRSQHTFVAHGDQLVVDMLGRFERFADDWATIEQRFNLPQPGRNHRVSGTPVPLSDLPISRASVERAAQRYERDITMFSYENATHQLLNDLTTRQGG